MVKRLMSYIFLVAMGWVFSVSTAQANYGASICKNQGFKCVKVKKGDTWYSLFPNSRQRNIVKRLNRMNTRLRRGRTIAVPKKLSSLRLKDIAPFPAKISSSKRSKVFVNQKELAWGAYSPRGNLVKWGPMSGGRSYCADIKENCSTPSGTFVVFRKEGADCESGTFPVKTNGGAPMPYCTFFNGGIAFHGSSEVPGHHASHGCIRMYTEDARWLNTSFVKLGSTKVYVDRGLPGMRTYSSWDLVPGGSSKKGAIEEFVWH